MEKSLLYPIFDVNILMNKKSKVVSSEEALKDITPFKWSNEVLEGKNKVVFGVKK